VNLDQIIIGDAVEVLKDLPSGSIDAVITDPPYFLPAEHYSTRKKWPRSLSDLSIIEHFIGDVFAECRRVLKDNGSLAVFCDGQSYPVMYVKLYPMFDRLTDIVWDKGQIGMGVGIRRQHELILMGLPNGYDWNGWESSVISVAPIRSEVRIHPAEKPVALLRHLCKLMCHLGQVVLDPFLGSGSTIIAAKLEGLHWVGIERDKRYAEIACLNVEAARLPLIDPEPIQPSLSPQFHLSTR
jgi:DNA modification methylase